MGTMGMFICVVMGVVAVYYGLGNIRGNTRSEKIKYLLAIIGGLLMLIIPVTRIVESLIVAFGS